MMCCSGPSCTAIVAKVILESSRGFDPLVKFDSNCSVAGISYHSIYLYVDISSETFTFESRFVAFTIYATCDLKWIRIFCYGDILLGTLSLVSIVYTRQAGFSPFTLI